MTAAVAATLAIALLGAATAPAFAPQRKPLREAYFGETHVHTSWSFDAYIFGNTLTGPEDAYTYVKGEAITATGLFLIGWGLRSGS